MTDLYFWLFLRVGTAKWETGWFILVQVANSPEYALSKGEVKSITHNLLWKTYINLIDCASHQNTKDSYLSIK